MRHVQRVTSTARAPRAGKHWVGLFGTVLMAVLAASCTVRAKRQVQTVPASAPGRIFVEALLTTATATERARWADKPLEHVRALVGLEERLLSNPYVLADSGQPWVINFPRRKAGDPSLQLVRYEVVARTGSSEQNLSLQVVLSFSNMENARFSITTEPGRLAIVPLENGLTFVAHAQTVDSASGLQILNGRKIGQAHLTARPDKAVFAR